MKRALIMAGAILALAVGVATAEAAIKKGKFAGKTSAADPIGFRVDSDNRVYSFYFTDVELSCTDGDKFDSGTVKTPKSTRFVISSTNKFAFKARNAEAGNGYDVTGKFSSQDKSKGTLSIFANFDPAPANTPNPDGETKCSSGKLKFTVKRQ